MVFTVVVYTATAHTYLCPICSYGTAVGVVLAPPVLDDVEEPVVLVDASSPSAIHRLEIQRR